MLNVDSAIQLAERFRPMVLSKVPIQDADDVLQSIRLSLFTALPSFRNDSNIETYAHAIAKRRIIDYYRMSFKQKKIVEELKKRIKNEANHIAKPHIVEFKDLKFTKKERIVLFCLAHGLTNLEMARLLFNSENTIRAHLKHIYKKLDCRNRLKIALMASQLFREEAK